MSFCCKCKAGICAPSECDSKCHCHPMMPEPLKHSKGCGEDIPVGNWRRDCPVCNPVCPKVKSTKEHLVRPLASGKPNEIIYVCDGCKVEAHLDHFKAFPICEPADAISLGDKVREWLPVALMGAWRRYIEFFVEAPHGTEKQIKALLELGVITEVENRINDGRQSLDMLAVKFSKLDNQYQNHYELWKKQRIKLEDKLDLMRDEFKRIKIIGNSEIQGLCDRAISNIEQNFSVIVQRDKALDTIEVLQDYANKLLEKILRAYEANQNMHCFVTKGKLNEELNLQTFLLKQALALRKNQSTPLENLEKCHDPAYKICMDLGLDPNLEVNDKSIWLWLDEFHRRSLSGGMESAALIADSFNENSNASKFIAKEIRNLKPSA